LEPIRRFLVQAAKDYFVERWRYGAPMRRHGLRLICHMSGEDLLRTRSREWWSPTQHLVRHRPYRVDISAVVHMRIGRRLFGRHVGGRAQRDAE
jgi:hypothetical protein